jgi:putative ABC transport system permease protein
MDRLRGLWRWLRALLMRGSAERELREELRFHVDMEAAAGMARGLTAREARRRALLQLGGEERFREESREARGLRVVEEAWRDVRFALRNQLRAPQFTLAAVLTLALGIGANTAIFSVVDAVLLRASPFAQPERLLMIWETDRNSGTSHEPASWPDIVDLRARARSLTDIGAVVALDATLGGGGDPERIAALAITPNVPALLGVQPLHGRTLNPGEGALEGGRYALLSEELWRRRFQGDAGIVGTVVSVNEIPTTIVGILPAEADLGVVQMHAQADYASPLSGREVELWIGIEPTAERFPRTTHPFLAIGRLAAGATVATAQRELAAIMADIEQADPDANTARGVNVELYENVTFGGVRAPVYVLLGAVALVLLIASVNVANLLLARTTTRVREVAVRRALGAAGARIRRQFVAESVVLTVAGAAAGVLLANAGVRVLVTLAPADIPRLAAATIDTRVLAFTAVIAGAVALVFGMAPVLVTRRMDLQSVLKSQPGRTTTVGRDSRRFRSALVIAEVALAVMLVIGAGLLLRSFQAILRVDPGFHTAGVLKAEYQLTGTRYAADRARWPDLPEINSFHATFLERVRALPGVQAAALTARHPLDPGFTNSFLIIGREAESADFPEIRTRAITAGYLETSGVPLLAGRELSVSNVAGTPPVAVINQAAARRYFPGADPIGQQIRFWGVNWRIVGVIGNERFTGILSESEPAIYTPLAQAPQARVALLARTDGNPLTIAADVQRTFREMDPQLALFGVEPLNTTLSASIAQPRFTAVLLGLFGAVALILAIIGVHGVLSYTAAQRTAEVGIRMALGASRGEVVGLVVREGTTLAGIGVAIGIAGALIGSRILGTLLFGIGPRDTLTFAAVPVLILLLAFFAALLPALRAARAEPMLALRSE